MIHPRLERGTPWLKVRCSTDWANGSNINLAGDAGLEPTHVAVKVLCLTDLANPLYKVVSAQGFEPRTHALEGRCSIQLSYAPTLYNLERVKGIEPSQPAWKAGTLPLSYTRIFNWWPIGESNPCYRRERAVSWPLDQWAIIGDPSATRTRDTLIKSQVLYRLS